MATWKIFVSACNTNHFILQLQIHNNVKVLFLFIGRLEQELVWKKKRVL